MRPDWYEMLQFVLVGIGGGIMGGFFGVGAGILMVPMLVYWVFPGLHVAPDVLVRLAFGTSLAIVIPTALSGTLTHSKSGNVAWRTVWYMAFPGMICSYLGSACAARASGMVLKSCFALLLVAVGLSMFRDNEAGDRPAAGSAPVAAAFTVGCVIGLFSGFFGIGGGIVAIPLMKRFLSLSIHRAVGSSIAFVFLASLVGTAGYVVNGWGVPNLPASSLGYVHLWGLICAGIPSIFFARWGARWASRMKPRVLERSFALLVTLVAVKMLWDVVRPFFL